MLLHSSLLQAEHAQDKLMFQLQHSLGSTVGLPGLVTTAHPCLFFSFFPFFVPCLVSGHSSSSHSVLFCALLADQTLPRGPSFATGWLEQGKILLSSLYCCWGRAAQQQERGAGLFQVLFKAAGKCLCHWQMGLETHRGTPSQGQTELI